MLFSVDNGYMEFRYRERVRGILVFIIAIKRNLYDLNSMPGARLAYNECNQIRNIIIFK